jgi:uncharacterized membrane protein
MSNIKEWFDKRFMSDNTILVRLFPEDLHGWEDYWVAPNVPFTLKDGRKMVIR